MNRDFNLKPEMLRLLKENIHNSLQGRGAGKVQDIGAEKGFANRTPLTWELRPTIGKCKLIN